MLHLLHVSSHEKDMSMDGEDLTIFSAGICFFSLGHSTLINIWEYACNAEDPCLIPGSGRSAGEGIGYPLQYSWASLVAQLVKKYQQCRRPGFNPWVGKIPWRRERLPTPVFWPGEFHGLHSLWGHKVSDTTEQLSLSLFTVTFQIPDLNSWGRYQGLRSGFLLSHTSTGVFDTPKFHQDTEWKGAHSAGP